MTHYTYYDERGAYVCDRCGAETEYEMEWLYCPYCGAELCGWVRTDIYDGADEGDWRDDLV